MGRRHREGICVSSVSFGRRRRLNGVAANCAPTTTTTGEARNMCINKRRIFTVQYSTVQQSTSLGASCKEGGAVVVNAFAWRLEPTTFFSSPSFPKSPKKKRKERKRLVFPIVCRRDRVLCCVVTSYECLSVCVFSSWWYLHVNKPHGPVGMKLQGLRWLCATTAVDASRAPSQQSCFFFSLLLFKKKNKKRADWLTNQLQSQAVHPQGSERRGCTQSISSEHTALSFAHQT